MKVAFLVIGGLDVASSRYRVWQYLPYLQQSSIEADVIVIPKNNSKRWKLFNSLSKYDLTFIQKKLFQPWEIAYIRLKSRKLVYDLDDSVMYKHTDDGNRKSFTRWFNFRQTIRKVDLVLAGNSYLMEEVKKYNNNVELLPTVLDTEPYKPVWDNKSNEKLTLGWIGSKANLEYLASIAEALDELSLTFNNLELKIVADDFISLKKMPVVEKKWAIEDEITDLQSFDIGIMPLSDDVWTRGKCGFKLLQYMATGMQAIGSVKSYRSSS